LRRVPAPEGEGATTAGTRTGVGFTRFRVPIAGIEDGLTATGDAGGVSPASPTEVGETGESGRFSNSTEGETTWLGVADSARENATIARGGGPRHASAEGGITSCGATAATGHGSTSTGGATEHTTERLRRCDGAFTGAGLKRGPADEVVGWSITTYFVGGAVPLACSNRSARAGFALTY